MVKERFRERGDTQSLWNLSIRSHFSIHTKTGTIGGWNKHQQYLEHLFFRILMDSEGMKRYSMVPWCSKNDHGFCVQIRTIHPSCVLLPYVPFIIQSSRIKVNDITGDPWKLRSKPPRICAFPWNFPHIKPYPQSYSSF